jgi:hypothetical protein
VTKNDPHAIMAGNLRRLQEQAEQADAANDTPLADGLWRAVQSHARQIAPFNPDLAIPALERVMSRFSSLAIDNKDDARRANGYYRLAQGAATDLAPLRLARVKPDTEDEAEKVSPERIAFQRSLIGKTAAELQAMWESHVDASYGGREKRLKVEAQRHKRMAAGTIHQLGRVYLAMQSGVNFDDAMQKEGL